MGGYSDWLKQRPRPVVDSRPVKQATATDVKPRTRLGYKEQRELAALPNEIEALEREQTELTERMSSAEYYRQSAQRIRDDRKRAEEIETALLEKFARWQALEATKNR